MRIREYSAAAAMIISVAALPAKAQPVPRAGLAAVLGDIDRQFICPEYLPDDAARKTELETFGRSLSGLKLSFAQASYIRAKMLDRHNCAGGPGVRVANVPPPRTAPEPAVREASVATAGAGLPH